MKDVHIRIIGGCDYSKEIRNGYYVVEMQYKNVVQYIEGTGIHTTDTRMKLIGLIEAVRRLKESCEIKVYSNTSMGIKKMKKGKFENHVNKVYLEELNNALIFGGHTLELIISRDHVERLKNKVEHF